MTRRSKIIFIIALLFSFAVAITFGLPMLSLVQDEALNSLLCGSLSRIGLTAFLLILIIFAKQTYLLRFPKKTFARSLLWCIPCLLVAIVNFPFSALISRSAEVTRLDLLPVFLLLCLTIGSTEELLFRGILHDFFKKKFAKIKHGYILSVFTSSAIFGLWHLVNLLYGASVGQTFLQVGYSFLIGAMLAVTFDKTENIWLCIFIHALFDVGGTIVEWIGNGDPQDLVFWILTIVVGVLCALHILLTALRINKKTNAERKQE